jgi:hypothetical protein
MNAESGEAAGAQYERPGEGAQAGGAGGMSEEELRAAYEAELNRITSAEVMMQAAVSLLNLAARRLGPPAGAGEGEGGPRDLEQVRDAIDGVRALMSVLERRHAAELGPLRDALSQLQLAYAREAQSAGTEAAAGTEAPKEAPGAAQAPGGPAKEGEHGGDKPGPAEASGRLWVPGR